MSPIKVSQKRGKVTVPCGKCEACLSNMRKQWYVRCYYELKDSKSAWFVTMTYADEHIRWTESDIPTLSKRDIQLFFKKLRKKINGFKYLIVGEYGEKTHRPHYHMLMFNAQTIEKDRIHKLIEEVWGYGHVHVGEVSESSINYTLKYMIQPFDESYDREKPFRLMSKRPAIGSSYIEAMKDWHNNDNERFYVQIQGNKFPLPRYYSEKIYEKEDRLRNSARKRQKFIEESCKRYEEEGDRHGRMEEDRRKKMKRSVENSIKIRKL